MIVWVAIGAACGLALLSLRTLAFAFTQTVDLHDHSRTFAGRNLHPARDGRITRHQMAMFAIEIAMSIGITLLIVGLSAAAALPPRLLAGALLAQFAVLGSLFAPPVTASVVGVRLRPAAIALGIAQLAHLAFVFRAIEALT